MWDEFNTCWLSILQRQKEMVTEIIATGQRPELPQSVMDYDFMETMGKELVRLCDMMEKHGLVDYQMGVWEEEIITRKLSFYPCLFYTTMLIGFQFLPIVLINSKIQAEVQEIPTIYKHLPHPPLSTTDDE
jgi:hypothetical protein